MKARPNQVQQWRDIADEDSTPAGPLFTAGRSAEADITNGGTRSHLLNLHDQCTMDTLEEGITRASVTPGEAYRATRTVSALDANSPFTGPLPDRQRASPVS